jgi:hypothetical protein
VAITVASKLIISELFSGIMIFGFAIINSG